MVRVDNLELINILWFSQERRQMALMHFIEVSLAGIAHFRIVIMS